MTVLDVVQELFHVATESTVLGRGSAILMEQLDTRDHVASRSILFEPLFQLDEFLAEFFEAPDWIRCNPRFDGHGIQGYHCIIDAVYFTCDAGPHPVLLFPPRDEAAVIEAIQALPGVQRVIPTRAAPGTHVDVAGDGGARGADDQGAAA